MINAKWRQSRYYVPMRRFALFLIAVSVASAQAIPENHFAEMKYRMIGPFRGGRTPSVVGVPSEPNVFYMGVNDGGVWKSTDFGQTWQPIFDDQPTGSIGVVAVAPSNPNIVYVGSGEGLQRPDLSTGDGMYKSTDAGKTWKHLGLRDGQQIARIAVDPHDPNRVFVGGAGASLRAERRARRVPVDGRRRDVEQGALQG